MYFQNDYFSNIILDVELKMDSYLSHWCLFYFIDVDGVFFSSRLWLQSTLSA